ncbi:hypothetical protein EPYR_03563 [Erwinia pyrifoliae DSM 12163]|nr:hypothetical protein EPYR_03553 [Erwinia pyrifoliae DSM 12163]CAY75938.1 hypothetical protein EPYR_03558 [Erwinia pyrifoliae DSM 12163]CAY75943.1 hypothetical protein EPYR_03563 [Erwinia pyrifoliae DSM 12163]
MGLILVSDFNIFFLVNVSQELYYFFNFVDW